MSDTNMARATDVVFIRQLFIIVGVTALAIGLWILSGILLLLFGSILVAVILRALAAPLSRQLRIRERWGLALAGAGLAVVLIAASVIFGTTLSEQMRGLSDQLSNASRRFTEHPELGSLTDLLKGYPGTSLGVIVTRLLSWSSTLLGVLSGILLVVFGGIYLAVDPKLYRMGFLKLLPSGVQPIINVALDEAHEALRRWLGAQLIAMLLVGGMVGLGLTLVGLPSAIALGVIAGLAEFVPIIGPLFAAIPIALVAGTQDWQSVLWAVAIVVVVQQLESNAITPLLVGRKVAVAPALGLFAIVSIGVLFGPLGLLFGYPLTIVIDVAVRRLYMGEMLRGDPPIIGRIADGR